MSLSPEIMSRWESYLAEEKSGVRKFALVQLDAFITALRSEAEADWQGWAVALSEQIADHGAEIPVRIPLFRSIIFPALHSRLAAGSGSAARILADFGPLLYQSAECRAKLPPQMQTRHGLILEAIKLDPSDLRSKLMLRTIFRDNFDFSLHELPWGVLYGMDGATVEQCGELLEELVQYRNLCDEIGWEEADREVVADASRYIPAYRDYLQHRPGDTFAGYLESVGLTNGK